MIETWFVVRVFRPELRTTVWSKKAVFALRIYTASKLT